MPYLRVRSKLTIYACSAIGISLVVLVLNFWPGVVGAHHRAKMATMQIDLSMLIGGSAMVVGVFATLLGLNLAAENAGHLEAAWTKPVSREGYALVVFAVDIAAMVASLLLTLVLAVIVIDIHIGHQAVTIDANEELLRALAFCGFPLCVYGWIAAMSASLKRNRGAVAGLFWPLMYGLVALRFIPVPAIHAITSALNLVNPIAIYATNGSDTMPVLPIPTLLWGWVVAALLLAAAVLQWRRLEI